MLYIILIITIVVMAFSLSRKSREARETLDYKSMSYRQGYWDGVRAAEQGKSSTLQDDSTTPTPAVAAAAAHQAPNVPATPKSDMHITINVSLYVASLLLVGGVSLLVRLFMPGTGFFWGLATVVAYYGFGFALYTSMPILRSVSIAFVGTALAAMPYVGYLLYQSYIPDGVFVWFLTSIVCLVAYFYAAIRLQSEVIGYAIIALLISAASSFVGLFGASILWFVVAVMAIGAAITFIAAARPSWLPKALAKPFIVTQHVIVPLAVVWALMMVTLLGAMEYAIVFAVATLYYGAAAVQSPQGSRRRTWLWAVARGTLTIAAGWLVYLITSQVAMVGIALAIFGLVQVVVSALYSQPRQRVANQHEFWLWGGLGLMVISTWMVGGMSGWELRLGVILAALTVVAGIVALLLRRSSFIGFSLYGLVLLPYVVTALLLSGVPVWVPASIYTLFVLIVPLCRQFVARKSSKVDTGLIYSAQAAFSVMALSFGGQVTTATQYWWLAVPMIATTLSLYWHMAQTGRRWLAVVANCMTIASLFAVAQAFMLEGSRALFFVTSVSVIAFYGSYLFEKMRASEEVSVIGKIMWGTAIIVGLVLPLFGMFDSSTALAYAFGLVIVVTGSLLLYDDYSRRSLKYADIGAIAVSIGLQRMLELTIPDMSGLLYSHWWIALALGLAYLHRRFGSQVRRSVAPATVYQVVALSIMTIYGLIYTSSHSSEDWIKAVFLLEHALCVVYGLVRNVRLFTLWGAVGVTIAILSMLPGFGFILLPLLGMSIIGAVIYVIIKNNKTPPPAAGE